MCVFLFVIYNEQMAYMIANKLL